MSAPPNATATPPPPQPAPKAKEETASAKIKRFYDIQGMSPPEGVKEVTASGVSADSEGAEELARAGAWREILKLTKGAGWRNVERCGKEEKIRRAHIHVIALVKLGERQATWEVLQHLDDSEIPFSLLLLKAELLSDVPPPLGGKVQSQKRLYQLFHSIPPGEDGVNGRRRRTLSVKIASSHNALNQVSCALKVLGETCQEYPADVQIHHHYCCQLMQAGHVDAAREVYDQLCKLPASHQKQQSMTTLKGLLAICNGKYDLADQCFNGTDLVSMNNKAVCAVYSEHIPDGVKIMEAAIRAAPKELTDVCYSNLGILYEMQSRDATDKKQMLRAVAAAYKGPDFAPPVPQAVGGGQLDRRSA